MVLSMSIDEDFATDHTTQFHHRKSERKPEDSLELPFLSDPEEVNDVISDDLIITASPEMIRQHGQKNQPSEIVVSGGFQFESSKIGKTLRPGRVVDSRMPPVTPPATLLRAKDFAAKTPRQDAVSNGGYDFERPSNKRKRRLRPGLVVETVTNAHNLMPPPTSMTSLAKLISEKS